MAWPTIRYSVGNEHDPGDPWGRSELVIHADGSARLDHYFSRGRQPHAWAGHVDAAVPGELLAALGRAGFPAVPSAGPLPPGTAPRRLRGGGRHGAAGGRRLAPGAVTARLRGGLRPPRRGDTPAERRRSAIPGHARARRSRRLPRPALRRGAPGAGRSAGRRLSRALPGLRPRGCVPSRPGAGGTGQGPGAGGPGHDSAPGSVCSRGRAVAGAQVASRRKAQHGSSRTVFHEGNNLSPGDTDAPTGGRTRGRPELSHPRPRETSPASPWTGRHRPVLVANPM